jgi:hypothetical protein
MPHTAVLTPCTGDGPTGPVWAEAQPPVRANWLPTLRLETRTVTVDGREYSLAGRVFLDDEPPMRSLVTTSVTGAERYWVVGTRMWEHPRVRYCEVTLAEAPRVST